MNSRLSILIPEDDDNDDDDDDNDDDDIDDDNKDVDGMPEGCDDQTSATNRQEAQSSTLGHVNLTVVQLYLAHSTTSAPTMREQLSEPAL
eukprot:533430-Prymnesium_polylepis.2